MVNTFYHPSNCLRKCPGCFFFIIIYSLDKFIGGIETSRGKLWQVVLRMGICIIPSNQLWIRKKMSPLNEPIRLKYVYCHNKHNNLILLWWNINKQPEQKIKSNNVPFLVVAYELELGLSFPNVCLFKRINLLWLYFCR